MIDQLYQFWSVWYAEYNRTNGIDSNQQNFGASLSSTSRAVITRGASSARKT